MIVLVITIIVIVILAVAVILSIANNNPIENANKAKFQSDVKTMQEELELLKASNYADNNGANFKNEDGTDIKVSDLKSSVKYQEKFLIDNGTLKFRASKLSLDEINECLEIGIYSVGDTFKSGENGFTINENGVLSFHNFEKVQLLEKDDVIISDEVKRMGNFICSDKGVKSITIPDSVTSIEENAFMECSNLTITMSQKVFDTCFPSSTKEEALSKIGGKEIVIK